MHPKDSPRGYLDISEVPFGRLPVVHTTSWFAQACAKADNVADPRVTFCQVGYGLGGLEAEGSSSTEATAGQMSVVDGGDSLVEVDFFDQF